MSELNVKCPKCGYKVPITEALTKEIESSVRAESELTWKKKEEEYEKALEEGKRSADETLKRMKVSLESKIREEVKLTNATEIEDLKESLENKTKALEEANEKEIQFRREKRELEEREKNLKLEVERTLDEERSKITEKVSRDIEASHSLKDLEKDTKIRSMLDQIEELKRRAEQGSQQMQGEIFETQLEEMLKTIFPLDLIEEVAVGTKGGDILQTVKTRGGSEVGKILWELKRTKSFNESWLPKLKSDGRNCKADICLLVSETLPESVKEFAEIQGVWCSSIETCIPLAHTLRQMLLKIYGERSSQIGKKEKAELVYEYLTGPEFKGRIEAIVEAFRSMKEDLESEKRAMERIFSKREKQIQQVVLNIAGMHGDFAGYMGDSLPEVKTLQLKGGD